MKLEENEYTIKSFLSYLEKKFGTKISGKPFNASDICQYQIRGYIPYRYGGHKITCKDKYGIKIITLSEDKVTYKKKK